MSQMKLLTYSVLVLANSESAVLLYTPETDC